MKTKLLTVALMFIFLVLAAAIILAISQVMTWIEADTMDDYQMIIRSKYVSSEYEAER